MIVEVIDEIAFQTNILGLNAAVEAVHAGEACGGRRRSAESRAALGAAAKETTALIEESIAKSCKGSAKLQQVTDVIRAITEGSSKVRTLVGSQEPSSTYIFGA
jgi:methyl-accepting chemotaxis protein